VTLRKKISFDLIVPFDFSIHDILDIFSKACKYSIHDHIIYPEGTLTKEYMVALKELNLEFIEDNLLELTYTTGAGGDRED